ncbi:transmembrane protein 70, mitochondrial [Marchantia polymorpha subsp. ruderalis]|uniref:Transmembrane protein 70 n=2 Tax=Marchantia polymorpha TaxID=3197 RepID=A0A176W0F9_MARPO|nr:hypothetical protein AXG93_4368s1360 [Marchantia polymorpha subsp. ruderalis]PTQ41623.1 hypothetical protein MARPO_0033s0042 [Marchantia polymorpha]PTQ41624.1 hypothetical protein MARPO_0033s0042 [Marchantia polymorpha]BBM98779.1 hypothetical protein Mp_1g16180 [Marchantia polymorpha subsp. ruderalis]BBM98780.1 hypothetical protein Mp_1g16180 [Marchantia polymorpha subsp. ruderalis]|eukprot:PTQ41623.1 hypothetical protein MARPO_0033s0042 [Marchantia polymorpha]
MFDCVPWEFFSVIDLWPEILNSYGLWILNIFEKSMAIAGLGKMLIRQGKKQQWSSTRVLPSSLLRQGIWARATQHVNYATTTKLNDEDEREASLSPVVYEGSMSAPLRGVKLLSASSCVLSVIGGPIITFLTSPELSMLMKGALSTTMVVLSASTTFALHWIASPYVHKLIWIPGKDEFEVQMLSWMAITTRRKIKLSDVQTPLTERPLVTFAAKNNFYYVDKDNFPDEGLLKLLVPESPEELLAEKHEE